MKVFKLLQDTIIGVPTKLRLVVQIGPSTSQKNKTSDLDQTEGEGYQVKQLFKNLFPRLDFEIEVSS